MVYSVPLNNQLAAGSAAQQASLWPHYLNVWTTWNHVRTAASIVAAILFTIALLV